MDKLVSQVEQWSKADGEDQTNEFSYIEGFPNHVITRDGKIFVVEYLNTRGHLRKTREIKQRLNSDGYPQVKLTHAGKKITTRVHRLVAESFIPNPDNKETVNHIDGNKQNNDHSNLEWADRSEQMIHAYDIGLKKPTAVNRSLIRLSNGKPVKCYMKETGETMYFLSARDCSKAMGYSERWCDKVISDMDGDTKKFSLQYASIEEVKENSNKVSTSTLIDLVGLWSIDKGLHKSDPVKQFLKVAEEFSEIAAALARGNEDMFKDSVGDTVVTLIILAQQKGYTLEECLQVAYDEIKGRQGQMVDGVFVKVEDLKEPDHE